ncbi:MAG: DUF1499 domain-containing protein [Porticoccaceae bacterium]|nr:DUF1499 domain-containing protein [Pseudomonadales bacterium]MCP5171942.1 DUF1499 domain-containing protein [Pseudomonadales bacterium]
MFIRVVWYGCLLSLLITILGWLAFRLELAGFRPSFMMFVIGLAGGVLVWSLSVVAIMVGRVRRRPVESLLTWSAVIGGLPALMVFSMIGVEGFSAPMIHDISTDTETPPLFYYAVNEREPGENSLDYGGDDLAEMQRSAYPDIQPLLLAASMEEVRDAVRKHIQSQGWIELGDNSGTQQLEAVATTRVMGFEDDIVFRLTATGPLTRLDIRSASRVGVGDLGANAERIRQASKSIRDYLQNEAELP